MAVTGAPGSSSSQADAATLPDRALAGQPSLDVLRFIDRSEHHVMNPTATLSSKYQISIPKAIRTAQHWEPGVKFAFIPKGAGVLLMPVPELQALEGIARGASPAHYRDRSDRA
jgi:AbrB family looped-hinge helix DNA binding protein